MIWLWRFLQGYLTITFCGDKAEQLLNAAAKNRINFWNLRCKKDYIIGNISIKNFYKLRIAKRGIKCKVKIIEKKGLLFHTKKYINRTGFLIGLLSFFAILEILSNFVWIINIEGNKRISTEEILNSCKKIGITECMLKSKINNKYDAQRLLLEQKELAWGSFNLEGCILTVNISETEVSDKQESESPSNIKASFDGKISKIDVTAGNVMVKVGDTVSKGDLLVSGVVEKFSSTLFVHSKGTINALTTHTFSAEGKFVQQITKENGKTAKHTAIEFFHLKVPLYLGSVKEDYNCEKNIKNLKLFNKRIPVKIAEEKYYFTKVQEIKYDAATLEQKLYNDIKKQVEDYEFISAEETDREIINTEMGMLMKITYNCEENIAVQDKILLNTEN